MIYCSLDPVCGPTSQILALPTHRCHAEAGIVAPNVVQEVPGVLGLTTEEALQWLARTVQNGNLNLAPGTANTWLLSLEFEGMAVLIPSP